MWNGWLISGCRRRGPSTRRRSAQPATPGRRWHDGRYDLSAGLLAGVRARGQADVLPGAWLPAHNYFLNHPLDYPTDPANVNDVPLTEAEIAERGLTPEQVKTINEARRIAKLPRDQGGFWVGNTIDEDSNAFHKFEAYAAIFYRRFGYYLPVIGTEGGAIAGAAEDPRYPPVRVEDVTTLTLNAYNFMLADAPAYFFAHTPWLLANAAAEHPDERFEQAAWHSTGRARCCRWLRR
ncbi:MAG: hypothetical protein U0401_11415 [Anaerolineae bacterium]